MDKNDKEPGKEYRNAVEFVEKNKEIVKTWVPEKYKTLFD